MKKNTEKIFAEITVLGLNAIVIVGVLVALAFAK